MIAQHEVEASAFHKQQCADFEKSNQAASAPGPEDDPSGKDPGPQAQALEEEEAMVRDLRTSDDGGPVTTSAEDYAERAKYIPLRLSLADRRLLRLLEVSFRDKEKKREREREKREKREGRGRGEQANQFLPWKPSPSFPLSSSRGRGR